jgi:hypothetical protein
MKKIYIMMSSAFIAVTSFTQTTTTASNDNISSSAILADFDARTAANGIDLSWVATSEGNMVRHDVERSTNGSSFTSIGFVNAQNSATPYRYTFRDAAPVGGNNYYRLRSTDRRGVVTYSRIININANSFTRTDVRVFPNPVQGRMLNLQMKNMNAGKYNVVMYNSAGQQVVAQTLDLTEGSATRSIDLPRYISRGNYFVLVSGGRDHFRQQVVVQ